MTTMREATVTWRIFAPLAAIGFMGVLAIGGCSDDGSCDYLFADVPPAPTPSPAAANCGGGRDEPIEGSLQAEFDCGNAVYTAATETCQLISCQVCADVDADFDGDVDDDL